MPFATVDTHKVAGIVYNDEPDEVAPFSAANACSRQIADLVVNFLLTEQGAGRIPDEFPPFQSGVGTSRLVLVQSTRRISLSAKGWCRCHSF